MLRLPDIRDVRARLPLRQKDVGDGGASWRRRRDEMSLNGKSTNSGRDVERGPSSPIVG